MQTQLCKNCEHTFEGNFCSNCGEPINLKRIDGHYIYHEIEHILHFDKGIFYTIRELLIRPGENIRSFVSEKGDLQLCIVKKLQL